MRAWLPHFANVEGVAGAELGWFCASSSSTAVSGVSLCIALGDIIPQSPELCCSGHFSVQVPDTRTQNSFLMNTGASGVTSYRAQSCIAKSNSHPWLLQLMNPTVPSYLFLCIFLHHFLYDVLKIYPASTWDPSATLFFDLHFLCCSSVLMVKIAVCPCGSCHTGIWWWIMHRTHLSVLPFLMLALEFKYFFGLSLCLSWLRGFNHIQYSNCFYAWRDFQEINALFEWHN